MFVLNRRILRLEIVITTKQEKLRLFLYNLYSSMAQLVTPTA